MNIDIYCCICEKFIVTTRDIVVFGEGDGTSIHREVHFYIDKSEHINDTRDNDNQRDKDNDKRVDTIYTLHDEHIEYKAVCKNCKNCVCRYSVDDDNSSIDYNFPDQIDDIAYHQNEYNEIVNNILELL